MTSKSNTTNNGSSASSNKAPGNSNDINLVFPRNSFATLNEHDKVFENMDTLKVEIEGNTAKDVTMAT